MKNILFRLLVAAALTLAALALSSSTHGQQAHEDATPTNSGPQGKTPQAAVRPDMHLLPPTRTLPPVIRTRMN